MDDRFMEIIGEMDDELILKYADARPVCRRGKAVKFFALAACLVLIIGAAVYAEKAADNVPEGFYNISGPVRYIEFNNTRYVITSVDVPDTMIGDFAGTALLLPEEDPVPLYEYLGGSDQPAFVAEISEKSCLIEQYDIGALNTLTFEYPNDSAFLLTAEIETSPAKINATIPENTGSNVKMMPT